MPNVNDELRQNAIVALEEICSYIKIKAEGRVGVLEGKIFKKHSMNVENYQEEIEKLKFFLTKIG